MKKILVLAVAALVMAAASANAQPPKPHRDTQQRPTPEQMAQKMTAKLTNALKLTPEQEKEVYAVQLEQMKKTAAHRDAMRKERQSEAGKMKGILTAEQYNAWQEMSGPRPHHGRDCNAKQCPQQCPAKNKGHNGKRPQGKRVNM